MKCPHCLHFFHSDTKYNYIVKDVDGIWIISENMCSSCKSCVLFLINTEGWSPSTGPKNIKSTTQIRPKGAPRPPCPFAEPREIADDYREACLVLSDSPKASAALSRRCLQSLLRLKTKTKHGNLADEIQYALDNEKMPTHLSESLDAVRNIGNFAAHPMKSKSTGEILPVEPQEAEWNLDVLEALFDFYFVQPELLKSKRDALNKKLAEAGKPPMK